MNLYGESNCNASLTYGNMEKIAQDLLNAPFLLKIDDDHVYQFKAKELNNEFISNRSETLSLEFNNPDDFKEIMAYVEDSYGSNPEYVKQFVNERIFGNETNIYDFKLAKCLGYETYNTINIYDEKAKKWVKVAEDGKTGPKGCLLYTSPSPRD